MFTGARASAQVTFTNDEAQFFADNPRPLIQNFNSGFAPPGNSIGCDSPLDSNSTGCFPPGALLPGVEYDASPNHDPLALFGIDYLGTGNPSIALGPDDRSKTLDIVFKRGGVSAAGVRPGCLLNGGVCHTTLTISAYGSGDTFLGSTQVDVSSHFDDFVGIESDLPIAKVSVAGQGDPVFYAIDELVLPQGLLAPVPTLSEWGVIAMAGILGIVGFIVIHRRKVAT